MLGPCFPSLSVWRALSIQGWLRGEHAILLLPKPQQMTTFRSVISLGSTAGQAIHFSTIKGQRSLSRAVVPPLHCSGKAETASKGCAAGVQQCEGRAGLGSGIDLSCHGVGEGCECVVQTLRGRTALIWPRWFWLWALGSLDL